MASLPLGAVGVLDPGIRSGRWCNSKAETPGLARPRKQFGKFCCSPVAHICALAFRMRISSLRCCLPGRRGRNSDDDNSDCETYKRHQDVSTPSKVAKSHSLVAKALFEKRFATVSSRKTYSQPPRGNNGHHKFAALAHFPPYFLSLYAGGRKKGSFRHLDCKRRDRLPRPGSGRGIPNCSSRLQPHLRDSGRSLAAAGDQGPASRW